MLSLEDLMKERMKKLAPEALSDGTSINSSLASRTMGGGDYRDSFGRLVGSGKLSLLGGDPGSAQAPEPQIQGADPASDAANASLRRLAQKG